MKGHVGFRQVQKMELEAIELRADTETRGAAIEGLQGMLARIEVSVEQHRGGSSPLAGELSAVSACELQQGQERDRSGLGGTKSWSGV